jgi:hypothetical protein
MAQCYALLRRGELCAAKIGGRGDYRIGREDLEAYIQRTHAETERWVKEHPYEEVSSTCSSMFGEATSFGRRVFRTSRAASICSNRSRRTQHRPPFWVAGSVPRGGCAPGLWAGVRPGVQRLEGATAIRARGRGDGRRVGACGVTGLPWQLARQHGFRPDS